MSEPYTQLVAAANSGARRWLTAIGAGVVVLALAVAVFATVHGSSKDGPLVLNTPAGRMLVNPPLGTMPFTAPVPSRPHIKMPSLQRAKVPSVLGLTYDQALARLNSRGFGDVRVVAAYGSGKPARTVVAQSVAGGTTLSIEATILIRIATSTFQGG